MTIFRRRRNHHLINGGGTGPVVVNRAIATNRNMFPSTTGSASANYVRHSRLQFTVPANSAFTAIQAYFPGWGQNFGGEFPSPDTNNTKSSIEYLGVVYPADFSGSNNVNIAANGGALATFPGLTLPANATAVIVTRQVGTNTTAVQRLIGQGTVPWLNEGVSEGTNTGVDFTNGVYAKNAVAAAPVVTAGNIVSCGVANGGVNYTAGWNVYAYEKQPDGTIANKVIGYCNFSAGAVTSISITSGTPPAGVAAWIAPTVTIGNAFSNNSAQIYGHAIITGLPSAAVKSLIVHGTSLDIGWGSTDNKGDLKRNFGYVERGLANRCGVLNLASPSQVYAGYKNQVTFAKTYAFVSSLGNNVTDSYLGAPSNDVQGGNTKVTVEGDVNTVAGFMRGYGHKVNLALLITCTTSTDAWATTVNQTPFTGFAAAGVADGYNADVTANTMVSDTGFFDPRTQYQDATATRAWKAPGWTADGKHPTDFALAFAENNATWKASFNRYA